MPQVWDVRPHETPEQLRRNDVEINAVVAYLAEKSGLETYPDPPARRPGGGTQDLRDHRLPGLPPRRRRHAAWTRASRRPCEGLDMASFRTHGPNLDGTGSKVKPGWLYAWVRNPKGYWHETRMPDLRLTEKEAADITAYLMSLKNDEFLRPPAAGACEPAIRDAHHPRAPPRRQRPRRRRWSGGSAAMDDHARTLFVGEKTIGRYGCFGCHNIAGFEKTSPIGVELTEEGSKLVERLDFGFQHGKIPHTLPGLGAPQGEGAARSTTSGKVKKPEELLRMPKFWVSDDEADAIVTARHVLHQGAGAAGRAEAARRRREVRRSAGRGWCASSTAAAATRSASRAAASARWWRSQIEAAGGEPSQALGPLAAAALQRGGEDRRGLARAHRLAARRSCADPSNEIRPWFDLRMPTFDFTEERAEHAHPLLRGPGRRALPGTRRASQPDPALLAAGHELFTKWQCIKCHVVAGKLPNQEPANMAPDLGQRPAAPARGVAATTGWPTRAHPARHPHAVELPRGPGGERVPGDPGRRPGQADRGRARTC